MTPKVAILGASIGAMIAAAELCKKGCKVTIFEKSNSVGGLYGKVNTPFGAQDIGMHVLYVDNDQYRHLCDIFGAESFHIMHGTKVDIGASANFGSIYYGSHYPSLLSHPLRQDILQEITEKSICSNKQVILNAEEESTRRFGTVCSCNIIAPILKKLWITEAYNLSPHALHCFFDLRRIVVATKPIADKLKNIPSLDEIIANPEQRKPKGKVFGDRIGLVFYRACNELSDHVIAWTSRVGVEIQYGCEVRISNGQILISDQLLNHNFDACIVAAPIHTFATTETDDTDKLDLSIYYLQLENSVDQLFPAYYILVHDSRFQSSRIVNYDSYKPVKNKNSQSVIAVEVIHEPHLPPSNKKIACEISEILPWSRILNVFRATRSLSILSPSLKNGKILDDFENLIAEKFGKPIYFTGLRTDTGVFFSHQTVGRAYDCALEYVRNLD